jgi:hypothetical protein
MLDVDRRRNVTGHPDQRPLEAQRQAEAALLAARAEGGELLEPGHDLLELQ